MYEPKRTPRWTIAFLRALQRTGEARAAALDAGVDHTTAYARRRAHQDFAVAWDEALRLHSERTARDDAEAIARIAPPSSSSTEEGKEKAQLKRPGHDRWSQQKEKLFFDELAGSANVRRAASAAGVSTNAVYARRMKQPLFRAKWDAVLETGRAAIEMKLVEAANRSFDPEDLDVEGAEPKVSVAEAIRIVQAHGSKTQRQSLPNPFEEKAASMTEGQVKEARERIVRKLLRLREREMAKMIAAGWSLDESHNHLVPPGWVRAE